MINTGDKIPAENITIINQQGQKNVKASDYFANKKIVLFALPGAFTPTCSEAHLPSYVIEHDAIKQKGIDEIICLSVNDAFVMKAWQQSQNAQKITMLADGGAALSKAMGLTLETGDFGGTRAMRYSMIIDNGNIIHINLEKGSDYDVSDATTILSQL